MTHMAMNTQVRLSLINGLITGSIADLIYYALSHVEFGMPLNPGAVIAITVLKFLAVVLISSVNTFCFFELLRSWSPITTGKGFFLGGLIASIGSFICSWVVALGTPAAEWIVFGTLFFLPVSGLIGSIAGQTLVKVILRPGRDAEPLDD